MSFAHRVKQVLTTYCIFAWLLTCSLGCCFFSRNAYQHNMHGHTHIHLYSSARVLHILLKCAVFVCMYWPHFLCGRVLEFWYQNCDFSSSFSPQNTPLSFRHSFRLSPSVVCLLLFPFTLHTKSIFNHHLIGFWYKNTRLLTFKLSCCHCCRRCCSVYIFSKFIENCI